FVIEDIFSVRLIYQKLTFILGGLLLPVDFLPGWLQTIARVLPFQLTTYAPAKLFVAFSAGQFADLLVRQILWISVIGYFLIRQYRWATNHLAINGG
ncbi:MAG: ABC transporter permease, partial [Anaerolineae bacterium]